MIEVREMDEKEIDEVLTHVGYGHLACCVNDEPYVVPIHYAYNAPNFLIYTTEGKKSEIIGENPNVCLQIEDVKDNKHWRSVIVTGRVERILDEERREAALKTIVSVHPTLTPAVSIHWMDNWVRENIEVIYSITPLEITGRSSVASHEVDRFVPRSPTVQ